MKIALAQMEVVAGMPKRNIEAMLAMIGEAKTQHADLIAFPEMCVGGYLVGDRWLEDSFCEDLTRFNDAILAASSGIALVYGNIFLDKNLAVRVGDGNHHPNKDGRTRKYNAVYVVQNGKPARRMRKTHLLPEGIQPKTLLPNYRVFDDERYFFSLEDVAKDAGVALESVTQPFLIDVGGKQIPVGFELCEDLWCEDYRKEGLAENPTKVLIDNGAKMIINLSASPWTFGKNGARDRRVDFLKRESGAAFVPFLYVNCVGVQNNGKNIITFDGGSTVYNKNEAPVMFSHAPYEQELMMVDEQVLGKAGQTRVEKSKIAQKYDTLIRGIQHVKDMNGYREHPKYVIGLSGGIDSSVVAALLVKAVGADHVIGVNMPTHYNSEKTKQSAAHVAQKLGIPCVTIPIGDMVEENEAMLEAVEISGSRTRLSVLHKENIQAKIRGTVVLSNLAAQLRALFTNNGNKLEVALGYATLYGDVGGAIAPIGDLTKAEVFELARYLNKEVFHDEVISRAVIPDDLFRFRTDQIEPSAELKDAQVDPMRFGYHCALIEAMTDFNKKPPEDVMRWYLEGTLEEHLGVSTALLQRWNIHDPKEFVRDLEWFIESIARNVFKRVQAPPIILTSKSAYGYDIRESILPYRATAKHEELKVRILKMNRYRPIEAGS
ncbi:NAD(+) synthase [Candidatus Woesearchaeota archaeon]|nr:NAD(+) synthase [Candidatus Woesearchaeota archaeon]